MIVVLVHIVVAKRLRFQRGAPHDIPLGAICLLEPSPTERVNHAIVSVHTVSNLELHLELVLLHLEDVILVHCLLFLRDARGVLEPNSRRPAREWTLTQVNRHVLRIGVHRIEVVCLLLVLLELLHQGGHRLLCTQNTFVILVINVHLILICRRIRIVLITPSNRQRP